MAKAALVDGLVNDALALLGAFEDERAPAEATSAFGLLALVAGQDVEQGDDGTWQIARKVAPDRVISVVDPETRHMHKSRSEYRDGYKAHIAIEPETGLVTASGNRWHRSEAWRTLRRLARSATPAKASSLHPHDLRHAFVTLSLDAGASLRDVQDAAGHADPRTTRRYDRARQNLDRHPTYALAGLIT